MARSKIKMTKAYMDRQVGKACRRLARLAKKLKPVLAVVGDVIDAVTEMEKAVADRGDFAKGSRS